MSFSFDPSSSLSILTEESLFFARTGTVHGGLPNGHPSLSGRKKFHPRKLFPPGQKNSPRFTPTCSRPSNSNIDVGAGRLEETTATGGGPSSAISQVLHERGEGALGICDATGLKGAANRRKVGAQARTRTR